MLKRDYKGKGIDQTLGLKRGKTAIKRENSSVTKKKIIMWIALFGMVFLVNYLCFVHLMPKTKRETTGRITPEDHTIPANITKWLDEGYEDYQEGNLEKAVKAFTQAIVLNAKETRAYLGRGMAYSTMGMYDKAIGDYSTAIKINPDYVEAYHNRGWVYLKTEQFNHTIKDCSEALRLNPAMPAAYYTRGMAYKALGLPDKARKDFQKGCELGSHKGCQAYVEIVKAE